ncbi:MAG TPA: LytR C-terminal domain-containing protein [Patescibacteria group bacterium]|nr:LytR C-terminal domain-containing protein [Patescibacteria group bacterium]
MRKKKIKKGNLGIAAGFSFIVVGLIFFSFFLRILLLLGESKFDGVNSFTAVAKEQNLRQVINFSPKSQSISILNLKDYDNQNLAKSLEIPIDGGFSSFEPLTAKNLSTQLSKNIFNLQNQKELNFLDFLRLFLFTNTVKLSSINEETISKKTNNQNLLSITSSFFADPAILEEKQNIEIINATETPGLGNRLANLLTNMGGNVILVTTEDLQDKSQVQYVKKTYTAQRIARVLGFKLSETKKKSIPDVIIIIGSDSLNSLKF